jgi:hypothetical protein
MLRDMIERNTGPAIGDADALRRETEAQHMRDRLRLAVLIGGVLACLAALIGAGALWLRWDVRGLSPAATAYARLTRLSGWAGMRAPPDATPYEYGALIGERIPRQKRTIDRIVNDFVAERYHPGHTANDQLSEEDWRALRRELISLLVGRIGAALRSPFRNNHPRRRQRAP